MNVTTALTTTATLDPYWHTITLVSAASRRLAGAAAAVATELVAAVARVSDVSMEAGSFGADTSEPIPVFGFAFSTLLWTASGS